MLTYPWKCTVLHCNHLGNTWKPLMLMTRHFDYCPSASEGDNQSVRSSAPVVSRCFPGGYNVKLYISRGRLAWWLLAFLCCVLCRCLLWLWTFLGWYHLDHPALLPWVRRLLSCLTWPLTQLFWVCHHRFFWFPGASPLCSDPVRKNDFSFFFLVWLYFQYFGVDVTEVIPLSGTVCLSYVYQCLRSHIVCWQHTHIISTCRCRNDDGANVQSVPLLEQLVE